MALQFAQVHWDETLARDCCALVDLAIAEDLANGAKTSSAASSAGVASGTPQTASAGDLTCLAVVPEAAEGRADIVARQPGVIAGLKTVAPILARIDPRLQFLATAADGEPTSAGKSLGAISGPARGLLAAERTLLNFLCRLSGVASLTRRYVELVAGTRAAIYDTRKTTPGWRRLEKYAVRCGGGHNHRTGLFDAILIKDNHLALGAGAGQGGFTPAEAVRQAKAFAAQRAARLPGPVAIVEVEVDTLEQLADVLPAGPDIVLLDNMSPEQLAAAVALRDRANRQVELEASGGVNLSTVRAIAESGVERISVGGLTHSAVALDIGLDWR